MSVGTVGTYALFQSTLGNVSNVEQNLNTMEMQLSSGSSSQDFAGLGGANATQYLSMQSAMAKVDNYTTNNNLATANLNTTSSVLGTIITASNSLQSLISSQQSGLSLTPAQFSASLQSAWQNLTSQLNTNFNGNYIFGGTNTNTPPVDTTNFPTLKVSGVPDAGYYQGSTQDMTLQASDNTQITYGVRADNTGVQQIMAGLAMAQQAVSTGSKTDFQTAYSLVQKGIQVVIAAKATVDSNIVQVGDVNTQLSSFKLYYKGIADNIGNTDIVAVTSKVSVDQGILQAAFSAFAKLNSLSLVSYLK